jgi:hypothetical protein
MAPIRRQPRSPCDPHRAGEPTPKDAVDAGVRSAALLRYHAAIESIADRLATTTQRLLGE